MPPKNHVNFSFHKLKLVGGDTISEGETTLAKIIKNLGFGSRTDLILKMDIEGSEYEVIANCPREILRSFKQISVEVHWLTRLTQAEFRKSNTGCFNAMNRDFAMHHVHANNCGTVELVGGAGPMHKTGGLTVADVLELSYVQDWNRQDYRKSDPLSHPPGYAEPSGVP